MSQHDHGEQGGDRDHPPSREGMSDAEVWEWTDEGWQMRVIAAAEEPNLGGSPAPVEEG